MRLRLFSTRPLSTWSKLRCSGICLLAANAVHGAAHGAEWSLSPGMRAVTEYTDNPRLLTAGGEATSGAVGELFASASRLTERSQLSLQPRVVAARYKDDEALNNDVQTLGAQYDYRWERARWSTSANFTRDTTLTSELGSTGIVQADRDHEGISVSGGPTFMLTERLNAGMQASASNSHYRNAQGTGLVDYDYRAASIFSGFAFSEQLQLTLSARSGQLQVPDLPRADKEDAALRLGMSYETFSSWIIEASAGPSYLRSDFGNATGSVYKFGVQRRAERWSLGSSLTRDLTPTGQGVLTRSDQLSVGVARHFSERLTGGINVYGVRNQDQLTLAGATAPTLEYARADVTVDWQVAEHWSIAFAIGGATQKYTSDSPSGGSYRTSIGIVWNGQQRTL